MSEKQRIQVRIDNRNLTLVSAESEDYVYRIANLVDRSIEDVMKNNKKLGSDVAYILAAFNIADKYLKNRKEFEDIIKKASEAYDEFEKYKLDNPSNDDLKAQYESKLEEHLDKIEKYEGDILLLEKELRDMQENLKNKESEKNESYEAEKKELQENLNEVESENQSLKLEKEELKEENIRLEVENKKLKEEIEELKQDSEKSGKEKERLNKIIEEQKKSIEIKEKNLFESEEKIKELQEKLFKIQKMFTE